MVRTLTACGASIALVLLEGCRPVPILVDRQRLYIDVGTFNIQDRPETKEETRIRMRDLASNLRNAGLDRLGLIAIQESRYQTASPGLSGLWVGWPEDEEIECRGGMTTAAECLANYLWGGSTPAHTRNGNAVIAQEFFELLNTTWCTLDDSEVAPIGGLSRSMVGARFRHKYAGHVVPFFSVHFVPKSADNERKEKQAERIFFCVKDFLEPGDLPPIVAGDFNCGDEGTWSGWNHDTRKWLYTDYYEASAQPTIDLIFVGEPSSYPDAPGTVLPALLPSGDIESGRHAPGGLSDHYLTWVRLVLDISRDPASVASAPMYDSNGRGCRPNSPPAS